MSRGTQWEYMEVITGDYGKRPWRVNGEEMANWKQQVYISDYLNELGAQGWELVSVTGKSQTDNDWDRAFYLKRSRS